MYQVLSFLGGLVDGLAESYDNAGHLLSREFFFAGKPRSPDLLPPGIPARMDPPLPPPPTFDSQTPVSTVPRITMDTVSYTHLAQSGQRGYSLDHEKSNVVDG